MPQHEIRNESLEKSTQCSNEIWPVYVILEMKSFSQKNMQKSFA